MVGDHAISSRFKPYCPVMSKPRTWWVVAKDHRGEWIVSVLFDTSRVVRPTWESDDRHSDECRLKCERIAGMLNKIYSLDV
jgi:hypothetical protein